MVTQMKLTFTFALVAVFSASSVFAVPVALLTPSDITQTAGDAGPSPSQLIDNSGLSGTADAANYATITHAGGGNTWYTTTAVSGGDYFDVTLSNPEPQFILSLDRADWLTDLVVWGYGGNRNEASAFMVEFSRDGGATYYDNVAVASSAKLNDSSEALDFGDRFMADTVRLTMTDNWYIPTEGGGDRVGLGEIKFLAELPEPSTLLLAAFGLVALVFGCRRGRRTGSIH